MAIRVHNDPTSTPTVTVKTMWTPYHYFTFYAKTTFTKVSYLSTIYYHTRIQAKVTGKGTASLCLIKHDAIMT
jgi:hypothetical protein